MANDNETVEQACESICELVIAIHDKEHNEKQEIKNAWLIVQQVKDRFLAAHKREMADEKRISDAVIQSLRDKKLEMAGEIAEKEAEVERLREIVEGLLKASAVECASCDYDCGQNRENCIIKRWSSRKYEFCARGLLDASKQMAAALSTPPRNCDRPECATTKSAQEVWRKEDGGKTEYYEWLLATSTKGETK